MLRAKVILFKPNGKYYTEEEWRIPDEVADSFTNRARRAIGPYDMDQSPDFRRIDGGAVLVESQEPWGYPHLIPAENQGGLLTSDELKAVKLTTELWDVIAERVVKSGPSQGQDLSEMASHVHAVQSRIMAQAAARSYPGLFRLLGSELDPIADPSSPPTA